MRQPNEAKWPHLLKLKNSDEPGKWKGKKLATPIKYQW